MFVDTAAEYWRGDASLAHTDVVDGSDVDDAPFVRRYLYAAAQHASGLAELTDLTASGARGANPLNMIDYTPLYRCALINLVRWVCDGVSPPPSAVPRWSDHSAVLRDDALKQLSAIPSLALPDPAELPVDVGARPRSRRRRAGSAGTRPVPSGRRTRAPYPPSTPTATRPPACACPT